MSDNIHEQLNQHVGKKLRDIRINLGISQKQLGKLLGVTYQQAHKYETGANRISASSLYLLAHQLNINLTYFFEGLNTEVQDKEESGIQRINLEMARNFKNLSNPRHKEAVNHLVRILSETP